MLHNNSAFTLIELLVVMAIGAFIVSLVTPAGIKLYDRFTGKIDTLYMNNMIDRASWEAFIRQEECSIYDETAEEGRFRKLVCGEKLIVSKQLKKQSKSVPLQTDERVLLSVFSAKGVLLPPEQHVEQTKKDFDTARK